MLATKKLMKGQSPDIDMAELLDLAPGYIYWKDLNSVYLGCNQNFVNLIAPKKISDIIGLSEHEMPWAAIKPETAAHNVAADQRVITTGEIVITEEDLGIKKPNGLTIILRSEKRPLRNKNGDIIGVLGISVDISDQKEAERRQLESEREQVRITLHEKEHYAQQARKVAHDIKSPLFALKMLIQLSKELPEDERLLLIRATDSIFDISNNLITDYTTEQPQALGAEPRQPVLVSDLITQLLSEKKMQYRNEAIRFELDIDDNAHFAFIHAQRTELRRTLSNLINNGVDASIGKEDAVIVLKLVADEETVDISVFDDGGGMSEQALQRIQNRQSFTEGKKDGHGLGLQQVWDTLDRNQGVINVQSFPGVGTAIQLLFPRVAAAEWIIPALHINPTQHIVILDDEKSIHNAWDMRFAPLLKDHPDLKLHHFTQGHEALGFVAALSAEEKDNAIFLSDYELLKQEKTGLEIIEASQIKRAVLVTSYYADFNIQKTAEELGVKILPKQLAPVVPIYVA